ncbi:MAG: branched-chain amino acid ABC transporter permease [Synergistetes bacterium]|nr:branched-chain amino acid ABC transporter permease [Synergistota bacterium]MCX8127211.1 branched-chain amino acid ABC transporter permease [Synergistota bacterium]MDW8191903.1 branched-chain amino acid ABC transporter permease [Synergistota bacterium]
MLWQQIANGISIGSIYALITMGLAMVYGILRILHVAHAGIYTIGAYIGLYLFNLTESFLISSIFSMALCAVIGVAIQRFVYYPLLRFPPFVPLIAGIAMFLSIGEICRLIAGPYPLSFPVVIRLPSINVAGVSIAPIQVLIFSVTAVILLFQWFLTSKTSFGLMMRATSQDMEMAEASGVDSKKVVALTFALGSAFAAIAGILVGINYNQVYPSMGDMPAYKSLALIVVGGLSSVPGAVIASLLLGMAETLLIGYAEIPLPRDALAFIAMIVVILLKPQGLLGRRG